MKSLADLEAIRARTLENINMRKDEDAARVVIGMATCGIAAGARPVMLAFAGRDPARSGKSDLHSREA